MHRTITLLQGILSSLLHGLITLELLNHMDILGRLRPERWMENMLRGWLSLYALSTTPLYFFFIN